MACMGFKLRLYHCDSFLLALCISNSAGDSASPASLIAPVISVSWFCFSAASSSQLAWMHQTSDMQQVQIRIPCFAAVLSFRHHQNVLGMSCS